MRNKMDPAEGIGLVLLWRPKRKREKQDAQVNIRPVRSPELWSGANAELLVL